MILAIVGSRNFSDYMMLATKVDAWLESKGIEKKYVSIISGGARGADSLAQEYARANGLPFTVYEAVWDDINVDGAVVRYNDNGAYNVMAGHDRNYLMAKACTHMVAFWDGHSTGTKNMIKTCKKLKKTIAVARYERNQR